MNDAQNIPEMLADYNRRSRGYRFTIFFLLCVIASMGIWLIFTTYNTNQQVLQISKNTQSLIKSAQASILVARQQNIDRQNTIINHIDCVLLLGKTNPNFDFQAASLEQSKEVLNQCAVKVQ